MVRFEGLCAVLIEQLRCKAREEVYRQNTGPKNRIMKRILHNDAQIRFLAEPWLAHCEEQSNGSRQFLH